MLDPVDRRLCGAIRCTEPAEARENVSDAASECAGESAYLCGFCRTVAAFFRRRMAVPVSVSGTGTGRAANSIAASAVSSASLLFSSSWLAALMRFRSSPVFGSMYGPVNSGNAVACACACANASAELVEVDRPAGVLPRVGVERGADGDGESFHLAAVNGVIDGTVTRGVSGGFDRRCDAQKDPPRWAARLRQSSARGDGRSWAG
jgi:hypothetical protein